MVLGICGSPRANGNTEQALSVTLNEIARHGIPTELITLHGKDIRGCTACMQCREKNDAKCHGRSDDLIPIIEQSLRADAIILASPVYFGSATPEIKCVIDRLGYVARNNGNLLKHKLGGAIVVARRAGHNFTLAQMNYFFQVNQMMLISSSYWNILFGRNKGEIHNDEEGMNTLFQFSDSMVRTLSALHKGGFYEQNQ